MTKYSILPKTVAKAERQRVLLDVVRSRPISTQAELVTALRRTGIACTQSSVSRDVRDLGLIKREGHYEPPEPHGADTDLNDYAASVATLIRGMAVVGDHLVVVHTLPGTADGVGVFIDGMGWPGVVGTVAGDDTLFAAVGDRNAAVRLVRELTRIQRATS
jgi:transcriptional regulator of arginine metabolism